MSKSELTARQCAIEWALHARDPSFDDWESLTDWLAADPQNAVLYDRATIAVDDAGDTLRAEASLPPRALAPRARWLPFAIAASLIATVGGGWIYQRSQQPALYTLSTVAGARRSITLVGAVRVDLNGDTSITLDRKDQRFARINRGQALFSVTHDQAHPFRVQTGDVIITDVGTIFDVEKGIAGVRVGVGEGEVEISMPGGSLNVTAGRAVAIVGRTILQHDQDGSSVGAWRSGRIDFADIPLAELATRVHRATGARIEVAPSVAERRVSGSIAVGADAASTLRGVAPLLGIDITVRGKDWIWSEHHNAAPS
jgi:transmembrane sensor